MLDTKGESTIHVKKQLFFAYARDKNLEKLLEIKKVSSFVVLLMGNQETSNSFIYSVLRSWMLKILF